MYISKLCLDENKKNYSVLYDPLDKLLCLTKLFEESPFWINQSFISWLNDPQYDIQEGEFLEIEKENNIISLTYLHTDILDPYIISSTDIIFIIENVTKLMLLKYSEILLIKFRGKYFIYPIYINSAIFSKKNNTYHVRYSYSKEKLHVISHLLSESSHLCNIYEWLQSSNEKKIVTNIGTIIKKSENIILIEYCKIIHNSYIINNKTEFNSLGLIKIIKAFQKVIFQNPEEFVLIHEPDYYSFMINPNKEIKIMI